MEFPGLPSTITSKAVQPLDLSQVCWKIKYFEFLVQINQLLSNLIFLLRNAKKYTLAKR